MEKSESEFQIDFYTKMGLRNSQIEESAKNDELATQEYVKVKFKLKTHFKVTFTNIKIYFSSQYSNYYLLQILTLHLVLLKLEVIQVNELKIFQTFILVVLLVLNGY
jgi:hypothetical protein